MAVVALDREAARAAISAAAGRFTALLAEIDDIERPAAVTNWDGRRNRGPCVLHVHRVQRRLTALALSELTVHGYDIATGTGRPSCFEIANRIGPFEISTSPQRVRLPRGLGGADPLLYRESVFMVGQPGSYGCSDGTGASGGAPNVCQRAGEVSASRDVLGTVGGVGAQSHVCRVGAAGEVALVADHDVVSSGPAESRNHTVGQLIREEMGGDGATPRRAGQARGAKRPMAGGRHSANPDPAQVISALVAFRFETGDDRRVIEPGAPPPLRNPNRSGLTDEDELFATCQVGAAGKRAQRKRTTGDRRRLLSRHLSICAVTGEDRCGLRQRRGGYPDTGRRPPAGGGCEILAAR